MWLFISFFVRLVLKMFIPNKMHTCTDPRFICTSMGYIDVVMLSTLNWAVCVPCHTPGNLGGKTTSTCCLVHTRQGSLISSWCHPPKQWVPCGHSKVYFCSFLYCFWHWLESKPVGDTGPKALWDREEATRNTYTCHTSLSKQTRWQGSFFQKN